MSEDKPAEGAAKEAPKEDAAAKDKDKEATAAKEKEAAAAKEKEKAAAAAKEKEAAAAAAAKEKEAAEAAEAAAAAKEKEAAAAKAKAAAAPRGSARGKLLLVAWGPSPAGSWEPQLAHAGFEVYVERGARLTAFQWANDNQPVAAVIDLSQNPDDGKRLASTLRITGATTGIPLIFCDALAGGAAPLTSVEAVLSALKSI